MEGIWFEHNSSFFSFLLWLILRICAGPDNFIPSYRAGNSQQQQPCPPPATEHNTAYRRSRISMSKYLQPSIFVRFNDNLDTDTEGPPFIPGRLTMRSSIW